MSLGSAQSGRVLVVMKGYIGDTVLATPLLTSLNHHVEQLTMSAPRIVGEVLGEAWMPKLVELKRQRGLAGLRQQLRIFRELQPQTVILVNRSFRSALSAWLAKIPVRIGHATEFRGHFLTKSLAYSPVLPESECYSQLGRLAGIPIDASLRPHLQLSPEEEALGADMVQRLGIAQGLVGLQPGARSAERALPISVSVSVARQLSDMGLHPVLLGAASELEWASKVEAEASVPLSNAVGTLEMRPAMALIRQMMCVVGADTGLMHLAAGLGVPTVTVFGPNPSSKWGHFDPPHQVVEAPAGVMALTSSADVLSAVNRAVSCLRGSSEPVLK